jgi:hypothetical protein
MIKKCLVKVKDSVRKEWSKGRVAWAEKRVGVKKRAVGGKKWSKHHFVICRVLNLFVRLPFILSSDISSPDLPFL